MFISENRQTYKWEKDLRAADSILMSSFWIQRKFFGEMNNI